MKKLALVGVILYGCILPSVDLVDSLGDAGGAAHAGSATSNNAGSKSSGGSDSIGAGGVPTEAGSGAVSSAGSSTHAGSGGSGGVVAAGGSAGSGGSGGSGGTAITGVDSVIVGVKTGNFTEYAVPELIPNNIVAHPDGSVWFTDKNASVDRITTKGELTTFSLSDDPFLRVPDSIVVGSDKKLWFTDGKVNSLCTISTTGVEVEFPFTGDNDARFLTAGPTAIWGANFGQAVLFKATFDGKFTFFPVPKTPPNQHYPFGIVYGLAADLWMGVNYPGPAVVGHMTDQGVYEELPLPDTNSAFFYGVAGTDGRIWYARGRGVGSIDATHKITEYPLPDGSSIARIVLGAPGMIWGADYSKNEVVSFKTVDGTYTHYAVPTANAGLGGITEDTTGNIWFTETDAHKIGVLKPP